jgi:ribosome-binding factor A
MGNYRLQRVANLIRQEVSAMLLRGEIKDPRVNDMIIIAHVEVARDISHATLRISSFGTHENIDRAVEGLNSAAGFLQAGLARKMRLRLTPKLHFVSDHSIEEAFSVTEKMKGFSS